DADLVPGLRRASHRRGGVCDEAPPHPFVPELRHDVAAGRRPHGRSSVSAGVQEWRANMKIDIEDEKRFVEEKAKKAGVLPVYLYGAAAVTVLGLLLLIFFPKKQEVAFDTLETARTQARENALWNAQNFRATDPRYKDGFDLVVRGDSTQ